MRRYQAPTAAFLHRFCRRQVDLEDITQETFIRAYRHLDKWSASKGTFKSWLLRLATNVAYDYLRDENRYPWPTPDELADLETRLESDHTDTHRRNGDTVAFLLGQLAAEDRLLMTLRYSEGYSVQKIASLLNWGQSKVKVRSLRARQQLETLAHRHGIRIE